jgi:hypothetical protein
MRSKEILHKSTWSRVWYEDGGAMGGLAIGLCDTLGKIKVMGITHNVKRKNTMNSEKNKRLP